jgi:hypothetical protein
MWNLVAIHKDNEAQIFMDAIWLSVSHLYQILWHFNMYIESYGYFFVMYKICQKKCQILDWSRVTSIERSLRWNHDYKYLRHLSLVFNWVKSMTSNEYKAIGVWSLLCTHLVLKLKIKTKLKMERQVWVQIIIVSLQEERKGLKEDLKITHHIKSITWINWWSRDIQDA